MRSVGVIGLVALSAACVGDADGDVDGAAGVGVGGAGVTVGAGASGGTGPSSSSSGEGGSSGPPDGSWARPFVIDALPYTDGGSTLDAVSSDVASYFPCAPNTVEAGPEVVYRLDVPAAGWLRATVDDVMGDAVDIDLHLLAGDADHCITRDDVILGAPVQPGVHYLVLDTWQDAGNAGPYQLEVDLVTAAGSDCFVSPIECDGMLPPFVNPPAMEAPGDPGCLPGMARVQDFCVDRYEAMVVEDTGQGYAPVSPFVRPETTQVLLALSVEGVTPQGHIDQLQAADACAMAGKRLCTNPEWLRACEGSTGQTYPYGNALEPGRCNDDRICHPAVQLFESNDSFVWSSLGHPCISQLPEGLAVTGQYATCTTDEGALDMMGNLHEWTSDPAGTFRGGFYVDTVINGAGCGYATTAHDVYHHDYSTGFRCCADAL